MAAEDETEENSGNEEKPVEEAVNPNPQDDVREPQEESQPDEGDDKANDMSRKLDEMSTRMDSLEAKLAEIAKQIKPTAVDDIGGDDDDGDGEPDADSITVDDLFKSKDE